MATYKITAEVDEQWFEILGQITRHQSGFVWCEVEREEEKVGDISFRPLTEADQLWVCDECEQEGVRANGKDITNSDGEVVLWFCYNCVQRYTT